MAEINQAGYSVESTAVILREAVRGGAKPSEFIVIALAALRRPVKRRRVMLSTGRQPLAA